MVGNNQTKNTTILAMYVVDYSAIIDKYERDTSEKRQNSRLIIEKLVKQESARIFNTAGDSIMIEFNNNYNTVNTAKKIQQELYQINSKIQLKGKLEFRMGINFGDVMTESYQYIFKSKYWKN